MLTLTSIVAANGVVGGSGPAYYWLGSDGTNRRKFRTGAAIVEAGWLAGIPSTAVAPVGSNLPIRDVVRYFKVTGAARFTAAPTPSANFPTQIGKMLGAFAGSVNWTIWN